jgi:DHA2 family methylenomycin A resistance protein-like MFS transporter
LTLRSLASPAAKTRHFDPAGQLLAVIALTALVGSIIEASAPATSHMLIVAGFAVALLAATALCVVEAHVTAPMLPLHFFRLPAFTSAVLFGVAVNLTYYGIVFVLSLYLQQARNYSTFEAGLAYLPLTATFIVSNVASAAVSARHGPRLPMAAGALIGATGFALLARLDASSPYLAMLPAFTFIPLGMGLAVPAMTTVMLASVGRRFTGTASGALNAARQIGGAIGVALFGALIGSGRDSIIPGLHAAAHVSTALLVIAATIAWIGVRRDATDPSVACRRAA